jgi:lysophospholipase L1-like esterase
MNNNQYHYLALGDSYTIGEMVPSNENFPNQVVTRLANYGKAFAPARIVAKTGWTTDELETGITAANTSNPLLNNYDFVTLLIGVNNQYRMRTAASYRPKFEELLRKAISYAGGHPERVIVLSIPDWSVTPFAQGRDRAQIAREIDAYNIVNKELAIRYFVHYINVTEWTREAANDPALLASDGLHPSGKEYKRWSEAIAGYINTIVH